MNPKLTFIRRERRDGVKCIAPFFDEFNVWDIPEKEWTEPVQKAIVHAFELGAAHHKRQIDKVDTPWIISCFKFDEVKNEKA